MHVHRMKRLRNALCTLCHGAVAICRMSFAKLLRIATGLICSQTQNAVAVLVVLTQRISHKELDHHFVVLMVDQVAVNQILRSLRRGKRETSSCLWRKFQSQAHHLTRQRLNDVNLRLVGLGQRNFGQQVRCNGNLCRN